MAGSETPTGGTAAAPRRRGARWMTRVGLVLVLVGAVLLGWVAWQLWGTSWQSGRKHDQGVERLEEAWRSGQDSVELDFGEAEAIVRIPAFGPDYAVPVLAGTSDEVLAAGFGRFDDVAAPGEVGNYALAGHRITHGEPLRRMPELVVGDEVVVETREATYTYTLVTGGDDLEVGFRDTWVVDPLPTNPASGSEEGDGTPAVQPPQDAGGRLLTLTTCAELFHTSQRLIAFAVLSDTEPR
ncbi:class E sortase [Nocardioides zeae]|uniref:Class E sortase n=1 Tax=Nocardioides imazamoxiresistens TaxID=3231893 RepID=A0ABU3Q1D3_9ACTN|nr:class E sortase [Nocardioides zeae]MDT9595327.1 class E sortase [Nocardioides zeae]